MHELTMNELTNVAGGAEYNIVIPLAVPGPAPDAGYITIHAVGEIGDAVFNGLVWAALGAWSGVKSSGWLGALEGAIGGFVAGSVTSFNWDLSYTPFWEYC